MSKNWQRRDENKEAFKGCIFSGVIYMIVPVVASSIVVSTTASNFFLFPLVLFYLTFFGSLYAIGGMQIIGAVFYLITSIWSKKSRQKLNEDDEAQERKFHWAPMIIGFILFGLGGFLSREDSLGSEDPTHLIFICAGIGYGALISWLYKQRYLDDLV